MPPSKGKTASGESPLSSHPSALGEAHQLGSVLQSQKSLRVKLRGGDLSLLFSLEFPILVSVLCVSVHPASPTLCVMGDDTTPPMNENQQRPPINGPLSLTTHTHVNTHRRQTHASTLESMRWKSL